MQPTKICDFWRIFAAELKRNILYESPLKITGIDLRSNGSVYLLTSSSTIYGNDVIVLDEQGTNIMNTDFVGSILLSMKNIFLSGLPALILNG